ncbi:hypothetical protein ACWIGW_21640 [Nocardia brasiliensis]
MAWLEENYFQVRAVGVDQVRARVSEAYPNGPGGQWWFGMLATARGILFGPDGHESAVERRIELDFAAALIEIAHDEGVMGLATVVDESLRIYRGIRDAGLSDAEIPPAFTPDAIARAALANLPLDREEAVAISDRTNALLLNDDQALLAAFYKPGDSFEDSDRDCPVDPRVWEIWQTLGSLFSVLDDIQDPYLTADLRGWMSVRHRLDMPDEALHRASMLILPKRPEDPAH